jgi:hypothetical protein
MMDMASQKSPLEVVAICDIWTLARDQRATQVKELFGTSPRTYKYSEQMLASNDIDGHDRDETVNSRIQRYIMGFRMRSPVSWRSLTGRVSDYIGMRQPKRSWMRLFRVSGGRIADRPASTVRSRNICSYQLSAHRLGRAAPKNRKPFPGGRAERVRCALSFWRAFSLQLLRGTKFRSFFAI